MVSGTVTIKIRHEFWLHWGKIAVKESNKAADARSRFGKGSAYDDELDAGLLAVCAAGFSVETLARLLAPMAVGAPIRQAWMKNRSNYEARLRETLKLSLTLDPRNVDGLVARFNPVIRKRGDAIHYEGDFGDPVPHPVAGQGSQAAVDYGAESAHDAVDAMRAIYQALVQRPKTPVKAFVNQQYAGLSDLAGL